MRFPLQLTSYCMQGHCLELFVPRPAFVKEAYENGSISFPYWSQVWPSALGLSAFLLQNPHYTANRKVLELAAGLGLPAMVAARNATAVVCSDYEEEAISAMRQSAAHNSLQNVTVQLLDWYSLPEELTADVLLLSDVSYDPALFAIQHRVIQQFLGQDTLVIVSTPQRLMAKDAIAPLLPHCTQRAEIEVTHAGRKVIISIMVLKKGVHFS